jgi:hypothetical protein
MLATTLAVCLFAACPVLVKPALTVEQIRQQGFDTPEHATLAHAIASYASAVSPHDGILHILNILLRVSGDPSRSNCPRRYDACS